MNPEELKPVDQTLVEEMDIFGLTPDESDIQLYNKLFKTANKDRATIDQLEKGVAASSQDVINKITGRRTESDPIKLEEINRNIQRIRRSIAIANAVIKKINLSKVQV